MAGFCEEEFMGYSPGDEHLTLKRCFSCKVPQLYEALEGRNSYVGRMGIGNKLKSNVGQYKELM